MKMRTTSVLGVLLAGVVLTWPALVRGQDLTPRLLPAPMTRSPQQTWNQFLTASWQVGDTGMFPPPSNGIGFLCFQVTGKETMLVRVVVASPRGMVQGDLHYFEGFSTEGLVDKKPILLTGPFKIAGTRTYLTTRGTRTVFLVKPLEDDKEDKEAVKDESEGRRQEGKQP